MNDGGMHQDFTHPDYRHIMETLIPSYLLIVDGKVIGVDETPTKLPFEDIPEHTNFMVAVGVVNEFGKREIVGTIADYRYVKDATISRITSPLDGNRRMVGLVDDPAEFIKERLRVMFRARMITDVACLKSIVVVDGFVNTEKVMVRV